MLKLKIIGLILLLAGILLCVPIAWVEDLPIEGAEFQEKMSELPDSLDLVTRRQQAMDNMIEEKLLLLYGREQRIEVSEEETEALFINAFSDHEMFMTEGKFDNGKFNEHKESPRIQEILAEMHEDILIEKTRALVMRSLEQSDDELLERYFLENVRIDVSYAQFDLSDVSISPQLTAGGARKYFMDHRNRYMEEPVVKLGLTKIPFADFRRIAEENVAKQIQEITVFELLSEYAEGDSVDMEELQLQADAINQEMREKAIIEEEHRLAWEESQMVKRYLERDLPIRYPKITTGFVKSTGATGQIPKQIIRQGLEMQWGEVSAPREMSDGLLITWLIEKKRSAEVELEDVKQRVWQDYIRDLDFQENAEEFRRYFYDHLDDYKVPALIVNRVDLTERAYGRNWPMTKDKQKIVSELEKYLFNEDYLAWVAEDNGLKCVKQTIYMEKYGFKDEIDQQITEMVKSGTVYGVASGDGIESFFVVSSIYPRYIPEFDDLLELGYFITAADNESDEQVIEEYYQRNQKDLTTRDSVSLTGVVYKLEPDSVSVDSLEIEEYYQRNLGKYFHEDAVDCSFLVCLDRERAELAYNYLRQGVEYNLVKWCFSDTSYFFKDGMIEYEPLPEEVQKVIRNMPERMYSAPLKTDIGWLIIGKNQAKPAGYNSLEEVKDQIESELKFYKADSLAYNKAKAVFDSTSSFNDCARYAEPENIFKTPYQEFEQDFPGLGNLAKYRSALMRLYWNEKLTQLVKVDNGYAVLFMRKKKAAKQLTYSEAKSKIKEIFASENELEKGKTYIRSIITDLKNGAEADSLLYFLGGIHREMNLGLNSDIPGFEQSQILIQDMTNHEAGYYSPVLKVGEEKLIFYHINDIIKVNQQDFYRQKRVFKNKVEKEDYYNWLADFREGKRIRR